MYSVFQLKPANLRLLIFLTIISCLLLNCSEDSEEKPTEIIDVNSDDLTYLEPSNQRTGDPNLGRDYLLTGDYVGSGVPIDLFYTYYGGDDRNLLNRTGINEDIPVGFTAISTNSGVDVVAPNCFQCHASSINNEFILGLGNSFADFTISQGGTITLLNGIVASTYGINSPEWEAYLPFSEGTRATGDKLMTETVGVNPADKLALILAAHRDAENLNWLETPHSEIPEEVIPSDIPPWWTLSMKNAMFYSGGGQGDFARISMASSLLSIRDTVEARRIDDHFGDVISFINELEAPSFPNSIDQKLADEGELIFLDHCSTCHGTYGENESYPNYWVALDLIQTDRNLSEANFGSQGFIDWYNSSWFGKDPYSAKILPNAGYVAPPLDGIWASAPYLHNGSVPDLHSLLNSQDRPAIWKRPLNTSDYNFDKIGWNYQELEAKGNKFDYDTNLKGYSNEGHYFGDILSELERNKLLEYLKTL